MIAHLWRCCSAPAGVEGAEPLQEVSDEEGPHHGWRPMTRWDRPPVDGAELLQAVSDEEEGLSSAASMALESATEAESD